LRAGAPIRVSDALMDAEGVEMDLGDGEEVEDEADLVAQLREFLDNVNPEDFGA
jgi:bifunctional DNase/RNase